MTSPITVYIWETQTDTGHVALALPERGEYLSLRPKPPWIGNIFFPVPATNATFSRDIETEGRGPDRTISLPISARQVEAIGKNIEAQKKAFAETKTLYHLFPRWNPLAMLTPNLFSAYSVCPFSHTEMADQRAERVGKVSQLDASHCSLAAARGLSAGGIAIPTGKTPWGITPSELGDYLDSVTTHPLQETAAPQKDL